MSSENIVKLNIGGTVFQTTRSTLTKFDGMFRTIMETSVPLTKDDSGCIFIDRDPKHFRLILNFIRDGHVALPSSEEDREEIIKEAQYYLLDDLMKLFDSKKPAVIQCKNHFLENHDQLVDAFVRCTKKGTIVVTHCQEKNSYAAARMSLIINEYDKDFDVYFLAETCHSIPRPIEKCETTSRIMSFGNIVKLNIGGTFFQTTKSTLTKYEGFFKTMLETDVPLEKDENGATFIDRDPKHFRLILNFMRDGDP